jgi:hypothetical protein
MSICQIIVQIHAVISEHAKNRNEKEKAFYDTRSNER